MRATDFDVDSLKVIVAELLVSRLVLNDTPINIELLHLHRLVICFQIQTPLAFIQHTDNNQHHSFVQDNLAAQPDPFLLLDHRLLLHELDPLACHSPALVRLDLANVIEILNGPDWARRRRAGIE